MRAAFREEDMVSEDLTTLPPEDFFRLAVERGGLDLNEVAEGLSPEAAEALRLIAAPLQGGAMRSAPTHDATCSALPSEMTRSTPRHLPGPPSQPRLHPFAQFRQCLACGRANQPRDRFCRNCGRPLESVMPAVTLEDLVAQGRLAPEQAQELRETILSHQRYYTAGTRYGVFGGKP